MTTDAQRRIADAVFKAIEDDPDVTLTGRNSASVMTYGGILNSIVERVSDLNHEIYEYMRVNLTDDPTREEWKELYTFTRTFAAMVDTARIYQRHTYAPF